MAVTCPGCGRTYHESQFLLGRSLHCCCGAVVAPDPVHRTDALQRPLRFMADAMLGRLARWLRILGFDTAYEAHIADEELVRRATAEGRIVLTRDRRLPHEWRISGVHVLHTETPLAQLDELERALRLSPDARPFTRCGSCNTPLLEAERGEVADALPDRVLQAHDRFRRCPTCQRVYWSGSHVDRIQRILSTALPDLTDKLSGHPAQHGL